jgi:UPF0176 protein
MAPLGSDPTSPVFLNVSFYRFLDISDQERPIWRTTLKQRALQHGLKGTILLAPEGINGFLSGVPTQLRAFLDEVRANYTGMQGLDAKESFSSEQPFRRMLVRLKKEIITMGVPVIRPKEHTGPRVEPETLKQWLDAGQEVVLVDTRNDYEYELGTFAGAELLDLKTFRQFPERLKEKTTEWKDKKVVMFCTGGIRCEKATALAEDYGFKDVWQLEGGILRYFERVGGAYWNGECFVFDHRVALDPGLNETSTAQCFRCRAVLSLEAQRPGGHECQKSGTAVPA